MSTVVSTELNRRDDRLCAFPFSGITINARGEVTLCCASPLEPIKQLKDIPDLTSFYNGAEMEYFRAEMEGGRIGSLHSCQHCWKKQSKGEWAMMTHANKELPSVARDFDADWNLRKQGKPRPIRFLEYTCSNVCNQTCSTCSSFFSSKWRDIEKEFSTEDRRRFDRQVNEIQTLTDDDIQKIITVLPGLNQLVIKGGEPWADKNNIRILNEALDVNPQCSFAIVSNMQAISASTYKMLRKVRTNDVKDFCVCASIDGVGKVYDWIRGGSFERTVKNMEMYYAVTGRQIDLVPFTSIQNYFHLESIIEYFMDKDYVRSINFKNVSVYPAYIKVQNLPTSIYSRRREALQCVLPRYRERMAAAGKALCYEPLIRDFPPNDPFSTKELELSVQWIEKMNQIRGFRLQDHISELKDITGLVARAETGTPMVPELELDGVEQRVLNHQYV